MPYRVPERDNGVARWMPTILFWGILPRNTPDSSFYALDLYSNAATKESGCCQKTPLWCLKATTPGRRLSGISHPHRGTRGSPKEFTQFSSGR